MSTQLNSASVSSRKPRGPSTIKPARELCDKHKIETKNDLYTYEYAGKYGYDALVCEIKATYPELAHKSNSYIKHILIENLKLPDVQQVQDQDEPYFVPIQEEPVQEEPVQEDPVQDQEPIQEEQEPAQEEPAQDQEHGEEKKDIMTDCRKIKKSLKKAITKMETLVASFKSSNHHQQIVLQVVDDSHAKRIGDRWRGIVCFAIIILYVLYFGLNDLSCMNFCLA